MSNAAPLGVIKTNDIKSFEESLKDPSARISSGFVVKDSGARQAFDTGAQRDTQEDKPRYDLIPPLALERVALLYARGAKKYDARNWEKGMPLNRFYASMMRHAYQFGKGDTDEDHLAAVVFNALSIMHFQELGREDLNDMPKWEKK